MVENEETDPPPGGSILHAMSPPSSKPGGLDRSQRAGSCDTTMSEQSNSSRPKQYESASESDAEAIYARIKVREFFCQLFTFVNR